MIKTVKEFITGVPQRRSELEFAHYEELLEYINRSNDISIICNRYCASEILMNMKIRDNVEVFKEEFPYEEDIILITRLSIDNKTSLIMESMYTEEGLFKPLDETQEVLVDLDLIELVLDWEEMEIVESTDYKTFIVGL